MKRASLLVVAASVCGSHALAAEALGPAPHYPPAAMQAGIEGNVKVEVTVDAQGRVLDARIVEANPAGVFDGEALAAAKSRSYPATGTRRKITLEIDFKKTAD